MSAAPEWRSDPLTGRRVLISPDRGERPLHPTGHCPFCEGHEAETPPEVLAFREPGSVANGPGWRVRVVPNRYAAVRLDVGTDFRSVRDSPNYESSSGFGAAEVILECPRHETRFCNLSSDQAADTIRAWRDRLCFWSGDGRLAFAQVFKNEGPAAGASVDHCHSQLIALPFVPALVQDEMVRAADAGKCGSCHLLENVRGGPRLVTQTDRFAVFCPIAPRFPGESWILPTHHAARFEATPDDEMLPLAEVLLDLLGRIHRAFAGPDFNLIVKSAPYVHDGPFHWRLEVLPRLTSAAGWEWATGLLINTVFPERAAELLRAVK